MRIKIKKLNESAVIPKYATDGSAGLDLTATSCEGAKYYGFYEYGTGLSFEIPDGYVGLVFPRSSISKTCHFLRNAVAVLDSDFRGEVKLRFSVEGDMGGDVYKIGDKIGQLIVIPYPQVVWEVVDELSDTERGEGGFGSTSS